MGSALAAGSEHPQNTGVGAGKQFGCDGRGRRRANVGKVIRGNDQLRTARLDVEKDIGGLDAVFSQARALVEFDQLHPEAPAGAIVTGHDQKNAAFEFHLGARRHDSARITGAETVFDRGYESAGIEQTMDFSFGQDVHWQAS